MLRNGKGFKIAALVFAVFGYVLMIIGVVFKDPPYEYSNWALLMYVAISFGVIGLLLGIFGQIKHKDEFGIMPFILNPWVIAFSTAFLVISSLT